MDRFIVFFAVRRGTIIVLLAALMVVAAVISRRARKGIPGTFRVSLDAIAAGRGWSSRSMAWAGVIGTAMTSLVPICSAAG